MNDAERYRFPQHDDAFQLRVTLLEAEPAIWRRVLVDKDVPLPRLHKIVQIVMGWTDSHLHQFTVGEVRFGEPNDEFSPGPIDYRRISLNQIAPRKGATCVYEYDFGDSWEHLIEVEDELARESVSGRLPRCLDGARACPPEDCGGIPGYGLLLEAIRDPRHPEHDEYVAWAGGGFDPETFDLQAVNKRLAALTQRSGRAK